MTTDYIPSGYISAKEAAELLGVSVKAVQQAMCRNRIAGARKITLPHTDVSIWIAPLTAIGQYAATRKVGRPKES